MIECLHNNTICLITTFYHIVMHEYPLKGIFPGHRFVSTHALSGPLGSISAALESFCLCKRLLSSYHLVDVTHFICMRNLVNGISLHTFACI